LIDILRKFSDIANRYSDAPDLFVTAGGYYIVSTCLGRFYYMPNIKVSRPNVWFIISSIPGRMRRSTILNYTNKVIDVALREFFRLSQAIDDDAINEKIIKSQIEDGNAPGIADAIENGYKNDIVNFNISSTECGDIIRKITGSGQSYSMGIDTLLSKLYYGESFNQRLSARGGNTSMRYIPAGMYVTMYSGMQEPEIYLNKAMSRQGLLRRIKLIYIKPEDLNMKNWKPPTLNKYTNVWDELAQLGKNIGALMRGLGSEKLFPLYQNDEVNEYIKNKAYEIDKALTIDPTDYNIYQQTQWEYEIKLAALDVLNNGKSYNEITMDNINNVQSFIKRSNQNIPKVMGNLHLTNEEREQEAKLLRVYDIVQKCGKQGATISYILGQMTSRWGNLHSPELIELVDIIVQDGTIIRGPVKDKLNRTHIRHFLPKFSYVLCGTDKG